MRIAREIELRLERLVDGISAKVFRGRMHPVDLANRLVRFVDLNVHEGRAGPTIANHYDVRVSRSELDPDIDVGRLEDELAAVVAADAAARGWKIGGPVTVSVHADDKVATGAIKCLGSSIPGPISPWSQLIDPRTGEFHEIGDNRVIIGRGTEADIRLSQARVSRVHAIIYRVDGTPWLRDAGSANGTSVNTVTLAPHEITQISAGDKLSFGPASFSFRLL